VPGTQVVAADRAVVPPTWPVFSTTSTRAPAMAANSAADRPAPPAPTTTTSKSGAAARAQIIFQ
jgi:hypothetical protein